MEDLIVIALICFFLPLFCIAIPFWFRYKQKKMEYALVEKALEAGKDIPDSLLNSISPKRTTMAKGIRNIFLGIGLGVFLWFLPGTESMVGIGFLIFCLGIGQVLTAYWESRTDSSAPARAQEEAETKEQETVPSDNE